MRGEWMGLWGMTPHPLPVCDTHLGDARQPICVSEGDLFLFLSVVFVHWGLT